MVSSTANEGTIFIQRQSSISKATLYILSSKLRFTNGVFSFRRLSVFHPISSICRLIHTFIKTVRLKMSQTKVGFLGQIGFWSLHGNQPLSPYFPLKWYSMKGDRRILVLRVDITTNCTAIRHVDLSFVDRYDVKFSV